MEKIILENLEAELFKKIRGLADNGLLKKFSNGDKILLSSTTSKELFLLTEGEVELTTLSGDFVRLSAPSIFGEISFLSGLPVGADVFSVGQVSILVLDRESLEGPLFDLSSSEKLLFSENIRSVYEALSKLALWRTAGKYHQKYVALVAHDEKKDALSDLVQNNSHFFSARNLISTENTSKRIETRTGLHVVRRVKSGPLGGDQQIGSLIAQGLVEAVFFFKDPLWSAPHTADVDALVRLCDVFNVPLATNLATAEAILYSLQK
jgi:methylglyoxal synthase